MQSGRYRILGINGWPNRSHDAAAALLEGGRLISMAEEERFSRRKHAFDSVPTRSIDWCLDSHRLSLEDIDVVAIGWNYPKAYKLRGLAFNRRSLDETLFPKKWFRYRRPPPVFFVDHHLAHAAAAFYASGFLDAAILIVDGQGESVSSTIAVGDDNGIRITGKIGIKESLGLFYESVASYVGLGSHNAGKLMGLAPYGNPRRWKFDVFRLHGRGYSLTLPDQIVLGATGLDEQPQVRAMWYRYFQHVCGVKPRDAKTKFSAENGTFIKNLDLTQDQKDLAACAQRTLENVLLHLAKLATEKTKSHNLVVTGGVGLNCSGNGRLLQSGLFSEYYFFPAANDAGVSYGAAAWLAHKYSQRVKFNAVRHAAWGPMFPSRSIQSMLKKLKIPYEYLPKSVEQQTARLIAVQNLVGWFQGAMEIGPRALGNRSILADPRYHYNHTRVNRVKGREQWRPLAPSILFGHESEYFQTTYSSPFMLVSAQVKPSEKKRIPAVIHIDGSTRYQSVTEHAHPRFRKLLKHFEAISGVPILLNTSFNGPEEPIVCSPQDAIKTFMTTSLDALVLEDCLIQKKNLHGNAKSRS